MYLQTLISPVNSRQNSRLKKGKYSRDKIHIHIKGQLLMEY